MLTNEGIQEVSGNKTGGKTLEMTVCNTSGNNFEDGLRLVVTSGTISKSYEMPTSIYEGQRITYRFFVPDGEIDTNNGYTVEAYYKEANAGEWLFLRDDYAAALHPVAADAPSEGVEIFCLGKLVKKISMQEVESTYSSVLSNLRKGIYIIRDKNGTRKFVKRL